MVLRDRRRHGSAARAPGSTAFVDRRDGAARFGGADAHRDRGADRERLVVQPEDPRRAAAAPRRAGRGARRSTSPRVDEELAVERDADRLPGAGLARRGCAVGAGQASMRAHARGLARRRDRDLVADRDAAALDAAGDDAAIVELVDRLHRQAQRQLGRAAAPARSDRAPRARSARRTRRSPRCGATTPSPSRAEIGIDGGRA